eukprot:9891669-Lingulodinium_polyedra.AAC.1
MESTLSTMGCAIGPIGVYNGSTRSESKSGSAVDSTSSSTPHCNSLCKQSTPEAVAVETGTRPL